MKEAIEVLLRAPNSQLDDTAKLMIEKWDCPPSTLQVLEVLDSCTHGALASGFVIGILDVLYDTRCKEEGTTHEEVAKRAAWRNRR